MRAGTECVKEREGDGYQRQVLDDEGRWRNNKQVGFHSEANREPIKGLKEEREQMDFVFCRDYSGYTCITEKR